MVAALVTSAVATTAATIQSVGVARKQASVAKASAEYNAKLDEVQAQQLALDANANIERQRRDTSTYLSQQKAAYAAAGLLTTGGTPMAVQATTAARGELEVQEHWRSVQTKQAQLYTSARLGRYQGVQQSEIYKMQATSDIFRGIGATAMLGGQAVGRYQDNIAAGKPGWR